MNFNKTPLVLILFFCFLSSYHFSDAQEKPKPRPVFNLALIKAQADIDSLNNVIAHAKDVYDREVRIGKGKDSLIEDMDAKILKIQGINNDLLKKLSSYKDDNLNLYQTNRILIIFNAIVGVLLLTTLIWFLRTIGKKKSTKPVSQNENAGMTETKKTSTASKNDHQFFDMKLEQLEKLGELKNKGVLNEEEFNRQKQQILGNG